MAVNKVVFGDKVIMDTTGVTVTENTMLRGITALAANGETITGTLDTAPLYNELDKEDEGFALDARQGKILKNLIIQNEIIVITPNFSNLPQTFYDSRVTKDHEFVINGYAFLSNPTAKIGDWEINFFDGYYTISGYIDGVTNIVMSLHIPSSKQVGIANI